jgi:hypothetical protein
MVAKSQPNDPIIIFKQPRNEHENNRNFLGDLVCPAQSGMQKIAPGKSVLIAG